ncbi:probable serine/threonine-protein kinase PBL16, partial [Phalaenopsis equestris]|uniref:probable serine/threonine-protein kinase PBL16 n=1 Tax=Phalaenopsis equestris TaxID=78828 RepID=UPI0009E58D7C
MGNCSFIGIPSLNRVSSTAKSESPKATSLSLAKKQEKEKKEKEEEEHEQEHCILPTTPEEVEKLRRASAANPLIAFTYDELKEITGDFCQESVLGGGGFGLVYKGLITEGLGKGIRSLPVAVKVHDGDKSFQGHREWL